MKRYKWPIPGPLLLVALSVLVVWILGLQEVGVKIVGTVPEGLPAIGVPSFKMDQLQTLLPLRLDLTKQVRGCLKSFLIKV